MRSDHIITGLMTRSGRTALARQMLDACAGHGHPPGAVQARLDNPEQSARGLEQFFASIRSLDGSTEDKDQAAGRVELQRGDSTAVYSYTGDSFAGSFDVSVEDSSTTTLERYRFSSAGICGVGTVIDHSGASLTVFSKDIDRLQPARSTDAELYVFLNGENPEQTDPSFWLMASDPQS